MNLKLKAVLIALGVVGSGALTGFVFSFLPTWVAFVALVLFVCYIVYKSALASLEFDQAVQKLNKKD